MGFEFSFSKIYSYEDIYKPSYDRVVPSWLKLYAEQYLASAQKFAPKFGSAERKFWYTVSTTGADYVANIYCSGMYVEQTAWDLVFSVPVGGFKFGDTDPLTNQQFPGGRSKHGSYITLVDKYQAEGELPKAVARTYAKYSGKTIKKLGFFSSAIRENIGHGIILSPVGKQSLQLLGYFLGMEFAQRISGVVKKEAEAAGMVAFVGPVQTATIET